MPLEKNECLINNFLTESQNFTNRFILLRQCVENKSYTTLFFCLCQKYIQHNRKGNNILIYKIHENKIHSYNNSITTQAHIYRIQCNLIG